LIPRIAIDSTRPDAPSRGATAGRDLIPKKTPRLARRPGLLAAAVGSLTAILALAAGPASERTLFQKLSPDDPVREVVRDVLGRPAGAIRRGFTEREWTAEGFAAAWDRARRYFPARTYLVRPGTYFMTHGFDPDGRRFMEIHDSDYLELCVANRRTFTAGRTVGDYARMGAADDGREAVSFRDKMGRLEPFFRDETSARQLGEALGPALYRRLLEELRDEDVHMLAAGLVHEGVHAGIDETAAGILQVEFLRGGVPVQWDELQAFMAESLYHARFCRWAAGDLADSREGIAGALQALEPLRRRARLRQGKDRTAFERERARAWTFAVLVRLRMREMWQSALRVGSLVASFRADYVRGEPPPDVAKLLAAQARDGSAFVEASKQAVQGTELALRSLEDTLGLWTVWSEGGRPFPPPNTDSLAIARRLAGVAWPDPPVEGPRALMRSAAASLKIARPSR
jgi:hypothetical protein